VLRNNSRKVQLSFVVSNDILLQCTVIWKCHYAYHTWSWLSVCSPANFWRVGSAKVLLRRSLEIAGEVVYRPMSYLTVAEH